MAGNLIELLGLKTVLYIGLGINYLGSTFLYFSYSFSIFIIAYFMLELGLGILIIGNISIAGTIYSSNRTSSLLKINLGWTIAFIVAPLIVSLLLFIKTDWRYYYIFNLMLLSILMLLLGRIKIPPKVKVENSQRRLFSVNKKIISNSSFIMYGMVIFFYSAIMSTFFVNISL